MSAGAHRWQADAIGSRPMKGKTRTRLINACFSPEFTQSATEDAGRISDSGKCFKARCSEKNVTCIAKVSM
jgi:hypothetical protein